MKMKKTKGSGPIRRARKKEEEVRRSTCGIKKKKNTRKGKEEEDEHGFDEDDKDEDDEKDDETCTTKRTKRTKRSGPILRRAGLAQIRKGISRCYEWDSNFSPAAGRNHTNLSRAP